MKKRTEELHRTLIRHAKGIVSAWEKWLNDIVEQEKLDEAKRKKKPGD